MKKSLKKVVLFAITALIAVSCAKKTPEPLPPAPVEEGSQKETEGKFHGGEKRVWFYMPPSDLQAIFYEGVDILPQLTDQEKKDIVDNIDSYLDYKYKLGVDLSVERRDKDTDALLATGTWSVNTEGTAITLNFDNDPESPYDIEITTLTDASFEGKLIRNYEVNMDEDEELEDITVHAVLHFDVQQ